MCKERFNVAALTLAAVLLSGCAARGPAQLVVPAADMTKARITEQTRCKQKTATLLICDGVEVEFKGRVEVKKKK